MSKIICDICGTSYQDTAECCPICGCTRDSAADLLTDEAMVDAFVDQTADTAARKKQIFDYDEANSQRKAEPVEDDEDDDFDEEEEDRPRRNVFVVILLTVLIVALLLAGGFLVVRYILPNVGGNDETTPVVTETQPVQTEAPTEAHIACETLVLKSASQADLTEEGFSHLINVLVIPEDTTDVLTFASADQSVATVSEDGKITAVGEGETVVTITCGNVQAYVNVVCDFTPATEATEEATEATGEGETTDETTGETTGETVAETEGDKEIDPNVQLKLVKSDIRLGVYYQFTLELDCSLDPTDVEWSSEHPHIATVNEEGVVTAVQAGTTAIIAKYGDQQVQCLIRCF